MSAIVSFATAQDAVVNAGAQSIVDGQRQFHPHQFKVSHQHGSIFIDAKLASHYPLLNHNKELSLIQAFDNLKFPSDRQFLDWARKLKGTRTYTYDEVTQKDEQGKTTTKPLVLFDSEERKILDPFWQTWLDKRQANLELANQKRMAEEREARTYQLQSQVQQLQLQILQTQSDAAAQGAKSLCEKFHSCHVPIDTNFRTIVSSFH